MSLLLQQSMDAASYAAAPPSQCCFAYCTLHNTTAHTDERHPHEIAPGLCCIEMDLQPAQSAACLHLHLRLPVPQAPSPAPPATRPATSPASQVLMFDAIHSCTYLTHPACATKLHTAT